jgi:hypothetical protein
MTEFTREAVHDLLRKALRGSQRTPAFESTEITLLTLRLNDLQSLAKYRSTRLPEEVETAERIGAAIRILTELMPKSRAEYAYLARPVDRDGDGDRAVTIELEEATREASVVLEAFDALMSAARIARERGIPYFPHAFAFGLPVEHWPAYARNLMELFKLATKVSSKEAAYRFIAAATPGITGETPSLEAVKTVIKRERDKNWGKHRS